MPITTFVNKEFLNKLSEVYPCKHCMNIEGKPISSKDIYDAYKFSAEIFLNFSNTPTLITQITEILNKSGEWFKLSCTYSNEWPIIKSKRRINIKKWPNFKGLITCPNLSLKNYKNNKPPITNRLFSDIVGCPCTSTLCRYCMNNYEKGHHYM